MANRGNFPFGPVAGHGVFGLRRELDRLFEERWAAPAGGAPAGRADVGPRRLRGDLDRMNRMPA
jgi:hypothetical protein